MWMSSRLAQEFSSVFSSMFFNSSTEERLPAMRGTAHAVTLTWHAPLSKAQGPGLSVSSTEPSGVFLSRFWLSSSRSLGDVSSWVKGAD